MKVQVLNLACKVYLSEPSRGSQPDAVSEQTLKYVLDMVPPDTRERESERARDREIERARERGRERERER